MKQPQEFSIIERWFKKPIRNPHTILGSGDDCALLSIPEGKSLAVSMDTLVSGVHFPENTNASDIGYKAVAANLSDLAAIGATPHWITGSLTLSQPTEQWLNDFCDGFFELIDLYQLDVVGGDLSQGPLSITIQAHGLVEPNKALYRSQAMPGDHIFVTGTLGDPGLALLHLQKKMDLNKEDEKYLLKRLHRPTPRIKEGIALQDISQCAIDVSDGLAQDLNHLLRASKVGAAINVDALPVSKSLKTSVFSEQQIQLALSSGDDYELCFTIPDENLSLFEKTFSTLGFSYTKIGVIEKGHDLRLLHNDGKPYTLTSSGWNHFKRNIQT